MVLFFLLQNYLKIHKFLFLNYSNAATILKLFLKFVVMKSSKFDRSKIVLTASFL